VRTQLRSPLRYAAAATCLTAAAAHVPVTEDHLEEATYIGVLFILLAAACCIEAVLLVRRDEKRVWLAAALTCAAAVIAYVWSRAIGLPLITDDVGDWTEPIAIVAITAEMLTVLLAVAALAPVTRRPSTTHRPVTAGVALLAAGLAATVTAAAAPGESSAMSHSSQVRMHMTGGSYWSKVAGQPFQSDGVTRTYYISADKVVWDYAPDGKNDITGQPFDDVADTYVKSGPGRIGSNYVECLYRGYTDASFSHLAPSPPSEQYMGILGPVIRGQVGDTIKVVFRNECPFPDSIHVHGLLYDKNSEGAPYNDGTSGSDKADDSVPPGSKYTYTWEVPERAGPGPNDGSSVMWMYHSHTDEVSDTYAGLMGPIEITRRGMARPDGSPKDVDQEVFALFSVMNENASPFLRENIDKFASPPAPDPDDEEFQESNLMHSIDGYVFGNQPMITLKRGEHVRWYVMSMGTEVDLHTPHWHGNDVTVNGMRMDVVSLLPASMVVADMVPDNVGTWLFHCHVNDHIRAGMLTRYRLVP
jgi:manganese oxidase